jgi:dGTPase
MRHPVTLLSVEALGRLDERLPSPALDEHGAPIPGAIDGDGDPRGRYRTPAQRDRDRILYSSALQRLGGVTQVTGSESGYTFHTRLTHSLKVAQVARRCAEKLLQDRLAGRLGSRAGEALDTIDPDAAEAAGLAHDLGHPPFGHVAEEVLRDGTAASFEGNPQSFRIVASLAVRKFETPGLELTRRTLNGILKYPWLRETENPGKRNKWGAYEPDSEAFKWVRCDSPPDERSLIAHIMDWADDVTYAVHDLDDFYQAGLVPLHLLCTAKGSQHHKEMDRFADGLRAAGRKNVDERIAALEDVLEFAGVDEPFEGRDDQRASLRGLASNLITRYLDAFTIEDGVVEGRADVVIQDAARAQVDALKDLTWVYVVMRPSLAVMQAGRREIIRKLCGWYGEATRDPEQKRLLPAAYQARLEKAGTEEACSRLVNDLVSGLTEEAALTLFRRMSGVDPGSVIDATARVH